MNGTSGAFWGPVSSNYAPVALTYKSNVISQQTLQIWLETERSTQAS